MIMIFPRGAMKRITIAMIEAGGGHKSPALALAAGFKELEADTLVEVLDFHRAVWALDFDATHKGTWSRMLRTPLLSHAGSHLLTLAGPLAREYAVSWSREAIAKGAAWILEHKPDLFLCTHYLNIPPALDARRIAMENGIDLPTRIVLFAAEVFQLNPLWIWKEVDDLIVCSPEARKHAISLGMPEHKISLFPYPLRPEFTHPRQENPAESGSKLRVIVVAGAEGQGRVEKIIDSIIRKDLPVRLQVICGRNHALRERLASLLPKKSMLEMEVWGFVEDMPALMSQADLIITKAGPATSFEALHSGLPILFFEAVTDSEMGNIKQLQKKGFAWYEPTVQGVLLLLAGLCVDRTALIEAKKRIAKEDLRNGYREISQFLLSRPKVDLDLDGEPWRPVWLKLKQAPRKQLRTNES